MMQHTPLQLSIAGSEVDLSENPNILEMAEMLRKASSMTEPAEMLGQFGPWIGKRSPRNAFISISTRDLEPGQYKFTRVLGDNAGRPDPSDSPSDPWATWDTLETHQGGLVWDLISSPTPKIINHVDLTEDPILSKALGHRAKELRSIAVIPAYDNGQAINWALSFHHDPDWNNLESFEAGFLDLNMMGTATRNLVSKRTVLELNSTLEKEFEQVGQIQRALTPESNPTLDGYELASSYLPSLHAGGDFYDYFQFPDGRLGVIVADVAGHGAGAATVMAMIAASLRSFTFLQEDVSSAAEPAAVAQFINRVLYTSSLPSMFVTAFVCVLDPNTGTIDWIRCGHNPPRIRGVDGSIRTLNNPGTLPLGVTEDLPAVSLSSTLAPGETLVMYTDGITEAARPADNESGFDMFGEERLDETLTKCSGHPQCVIDSLSAAVRAFTGSDHRKDDQTVVVVRHNDSNS
ncbi:MAG: PP2C family protein-serine/threonine phosphatase [Phycisphaerales bacterium]